MKKAEDVEVFEFVPAFQEVEFYGKAQAADVSAELLHEFHSCFHRAAGGEEVIDDDHVLPRFDGIKVDLQRIRPVFQVIGDTRYRRGQLARFAYWDESGVEA